MTAQIDVFGSGEKPKNLSDRVVVLSEAIQALAIALRENKWEDPILQQTAIASFDSLVTSLTALITTGALRDEQLVVDVITKLDDTTKEMLDGVVLRGTTKKLVEIEEDDDGNVTVVPAGPGIAKVQASASDATKNLLEE